MPRKVVHLIPYDGVGGVERAAASSEGATLGDLRLERMFVFEDVRDRTGRAGTFNPLALWSAAGRLAKAQPALVILSLWRAALVGMLARLRGCRAPMVLFLHNSRDAHAMDRRVTHMAARMAEAIWADSRQTLDQRLVLPPGKPTRVISYLVEKLPPVRSGDVPPSPDFVFWGRLAEQKNPLRSVRFFERIRDLHPRATLTLIGPDGGLEQQLRDTIAKHGLESAITLAGLQDRSAIEKVAGAASFYLQTSRYEGMALSVMEAMQAGLVPVVTPVGEIARYTADGETAIWIDDGAGEEQAVARVHELIENPGQWRDMRQQGIAVFSDWPLYRDDIMQAAQDVLAETDCQRPVAQ